MSTSYQIMVIEIHKNGVLIGWEDFEARFVLNDDGKLTLIGKAKMGGGECWIPDLVYEAMCAEAVAILTDQRNRRNKKKKLPPPIQLFLF